MPTFQGMVSEEQLNALVAYVKSMSGVRRKQTNYAAGRCPCADQGNQVQ